MRVEAWPKTGGGSVGSIDAMAEVPFYIVSTGPSARPRSTLKRDDTFARPPRIARLAPRSAPFVGRPR